MVDMAEVGTTRADWPVARTYIDEDRVRISLPVGGIGTGSVGFGGRGQFRDWELENHPSKGTRSQLTFLACQVRQASGAWAARILEGDLFDEEVEGAQGSPAPLAGLPRFAECQFETTYPFGRVNLADPHFPVRSSVEVFNPFSPADEQVSGLPIAVVSVVVESVTDEPLDCSILLSAEAMVGHGARLAGLASNPRATVRSEAGLNGYLLSDQAVEPGSEAAGTLAAAVLGDDAWVGPSWGLGKWNQGLLEMWRSFADNGEPAPGTFGPGTASRRQRTPLLSLARSGPGARWGRGRKPKSCSFWLGISRTVTRGSGGHGDREAPPVRRQSATFTPKALPTPGTSSLARPASYLCCGRRRSVSWPRSGKAT